ncbi:MAG: pyridoxal phosphate-dependent aminotransferase [Thermomicrobiales bacterium]|nr:pyridoxal phosphate-dependent aminotransferase [Thermomicrobiales bacterium]MCO5227561.1 pyridoxal phosphate-dependent aminotransferase [Thermomicrobiales bacterium]
MTEQITRDHLFARRVRNVAPSPTLAVSQRARELRAEGIDVIDLGGGDPDFITPEHIREAAAAAMNAGDTHYAPSPGTPQLLEAIAKKLHEDNEISVNPKTDIIVTPGGKSAIYQAIMTFVEPGVDVMLLEPAWVSYMPMVEMAGGRVIGVPLDPDNRFAITRDLLEQYVTPATRVILLNSPNNPTGRVATIQELNDIADFAKAHDLIVLTDEMYEKIIFEDNVHISIATLPDMHDRTLTFNGLSKAYAMTGWRLGYVAGPTDLIKKIMIMQSHSVTCATSFAMAGAVAAYSGPQDIINEMVAAWDRRRILITEGLNAIKGLNVDPIEGAFYGYVDGRETGMSIEELCKKLLDDAHVAVVPGTAFGDSCTGHFRLSFATSDLLLEHSIQRIGNVLGYK